MRMDLSAFIINVRNWLKAGKLILTNLMLLLLTISLPFFTVFFVPLDQAVRLWAMFLQLVGAFTVWYNLTRTAKELGKGDIHPIASAWGWIKAFPLRKTHYLAAANSVQKNTCSGGRIVCRKPTPPESTLESRVEILEFNVTHIDADLARTNTAIETASSELRKLITEEVTQRKSADSLHSKNLENATVGNYAWLVSGICWASVGIVFSSLTPEIVKLGFPS